MDEVIKSGHEIVDDFFKVQIASDAAIDDETKKILLDLFKSGQLSADNIGAKLEEARGRK